MARLSGWEVGANPRVRPRSTALIDILFVLVLIAGVVAVVQASRSEPAEVTIVRQYLESEARGDQGASRLLLVSPETYQAVPADVARQAIRSIRRHRSLNVDGAYDYVDVEFAGGATLRFDMELFPTMERAPRILKWFPQ